MLLCGRTSQHMFFSLMDSAHGSAHARRYRQNLPFKPRQQLVMFCVNLLLCLLAHVLCTLLPQVWA
jgi:hypothetical protein